MVLVDCLRLVGLFCLLAFSLFVCCGDVVSVCLVYWWVFWCFLLFGSFIDVLLVCDFALGFVCVNCCDVGLVFRGCVCV